MKNSLKLMVELQKTDDEIQSFDSLLVQLPSQLEADSGHLKEARQKHAEFLKNLEETKKLRIRKEREVEEKQEAIKKANQKLHEIKTNQEYTAALREIENHKKSIAVLEDEQIELMERVEQSGREEAELKEKLAEEEKRFAAVKKEKEAEIEELKKQKEAVVSRRAELTAKIDPVFAGKYERVAAARKGRAMAELKGDYCSACHTMVLPQMAVEIRVGKVIHNCPNCYRFLYSVQAEPQKVETTEGGRAVAGS